MCVCACVCFFFFFFREQELADRFVFGFRSMEAKRAVEMTAWLGLGDE